MENTNNQEEDPIDSDNDEDSSYIEYEAEEEYHRHHRLKDVLHKLKKNDPTITHLRITLSLDHNGECFFNNFDWEEDGDCISDNTHLTNIAIYYNNRSDHAYEHPYALGEVGHNLPTRQQLQGLFSCIYRNKSISCIKVSSIQIDDEFGTGLLKGLCGHSSLIRLEIERGSLKSTGCRAIMEVMQHPTSKLKELRLPSCQLDNQGLGILCDALMDSALKKLCLSRNRNITSLGWQALSTVIRHPNCQLVKLELQDTLDSDNELRILGNALIGSSVKGLDLRGSVMIRFNPSISSEGWQTFINHLSQTHLVCLDLRYNKTIDDDSLAGLASIGTLQSLVLSSNNTITPSGWKFLFNSLQRRTTKLKKLDISYNNIGNEGINALGSLLCSMSTLKTLDIDKISYSYPEQDNPNNYVANITPQSWVSLFTTLQDTNLDLVNLSVGRNTIDDDGMQLLIRMVSRMSSLKCLHLRCNRSVTPAGWQALTGLIRSPLRELDLDSNGLKLGLGILVAFTSALTHNKTLETLVVEHARGDVNGNDVITNRGRAAVCNLLCNKTSIMDTYNSNHTLRLLRCYYPAERLQDYLDLNKNEDKVEVARQKILQTHFSGESEGIQELLDMELEVIPSAIAWIGRPTIFWFGKSMSGLSTMYNLIRRLPDLFDSSPTKETSRNKEKS